VEKLRLAKTLCIVSIFCIATALASAAATSVEAEKVLYTFRGGSHDGAYPNALTADGKGNLYGTTVEGGNPSCASGYGCGTVYELTPVQGGSWSQTTIYEFTGGDDGAGPLTTLALDKAGNIYGTTYAGGDPTCRCGVVFELSPAPGGWQESTLYAFTSPYGWGPDGGVIADSNGNLYGTTLDGGADGIGTVFELSLSGDKWNETVLHSFSGAKNGDGSAPVATLTFDASGNLYGTTLGGGDPSCNHGAGCGTVFELTPNGSSWNERVIYSFQGGNDGNGVLAGVVVDRAGNLYGTTAGYSGDGFGTVFELTPSSLGWNESILYTFTGGTDGAYSYGGVILDNAGNLYGATNAGGTHGAGVVFELSRIANGWTENVLYNFTGGIDGGGPGGSFGSGLLMDSSNNIYGSTGYGGKGFGVVFEVRGPGTPFLSFPLQHKTALTAKIISVFDHFSDYQYCADNIVVAYDGERGDHRDDRNPTNSFCRSTNSWNLLYGWSQKNSFPFNINGQYVGDGDPHFLEYDGHPGFDFKTKDQSPDGKIPVMAAADGTVVCSNVPKDCTDGTTVDPCIEGPGEIKVKHANGYFSIYLHLSSSLVAAGERVSSQQQIAVSGGTGTPHCASPHLHFEIRKERPPCGFDPKCICDRAQTNTKHCIPVDPYGWWGAGNDPYDRAPNLNLWN
jgi:uncharacterized repeat protein (TIGR03803 family)